MSEAANKVSNNSASESAPPATQSTTATTAAPKQEATDSASSEPTAPSPVAAAALPVAPPPTSTSSSKSSGSNSKESSSSKKRNSANKGATGTTSSTTATTTSAAASSPAGAVDDKEVKGAAVAAVEAAAAPSVKKEKESAEKEKAKAKPEAVKEKESKKVKKEATSEKDGDVAKAEATKEKESEKSKTAPTAAAASPKEKKAKEKPSKTAETAGKEKEKEKTAATAKEKSGEMGAENVAEKAGEKPGDGKTGNADGKRSSVKEEKKVDEAPKSPTKRASAIEQERALEQPKPEANKQIETPQVPVAQSENSIFTEPSPKSPTESAASTEATVPKPPTKPMETPSEDTVDKGQGVNGHMEKRDSRGPPASPVAGTPLSTQTLSVRVSGSTAAESAASPEEDGSSSEAVMLRRQRSPVAVPSIAETNGLAAVPKGSKAGGAFGFESEVAALSQRVLRSAGDGVAVLMASLGYNAGLFDVFAQSQVPLSAAEVSNATGLVLPYVETWLANQSLAGFVSRIDADADDPPLYFLSEAQRQVFVELEHSECQVACLHNFAGQAFNIINRLPREFRDGAGIPWTQMHPLTQQFPELIKRRGGGDAFLGALVDALPSGLRARLIGGLGPGDIATSSTRPLVVLEVLCGHGFTLREFARRHPSHLFVGLDVRGSSLAIAHRLAVLTARQMGLEKSLGNLVFVEGDPHDVRSPDEMRGVREAWRSMCPNLPLPERFDIVLIVDALSNLADPMAALVSVQQHTSGAVLVQMGLPGVSEMLVSASQCSVTVPCALAGRPDELPVTMEFSGDILQAARISGFSNASRSGDSIFVLVP